MREVLARRRRRRRRRMTEPTTAAALVAWKSQLGVQASQARVLRASARGWGRSGALSEALVTRHGDVEGFYAPLPAPPSSLFIGFSTMASSLHAAARAHQDDLDFAIRISADGSLSYHSKQRAKQYYHAQQMESEAIGSVEKGDTIGMRLFSDRNGFSVFKLERDGADGAATSREHTLKAFNEVLAFPMKVMVVFGTSGAQIGPVCWLRRPGAPAPTLGHPPTGATGGPSDLLPPAPQSSGWAGSSSRVVKGQHAGELLDKGAVDDTGNLLLMRESEEGSWAAGVVQMVKPKGTIDDDKLYGAAVSLLGDTGARRSAGSTAKLAKSSLGASAKALSLLPVRAAKVGVTAKEAARARAATAAALQPKVVGKGERLLPKSARPAPPPAAPAGTNTASANSKRPRAVKEPWAVSTDESAPRDAAIRVPLSRAIWSMVCLARQSPFLTREQRDAIAEVTELHRGACSSLQPTTLPEAKPLIVHAAADAAQVGPVGSAKQLAGRTQVTLRQVRLVLAAIEALIPGTELSRPPEMLSRDPDTEQRGRLPPFFSLCHQGCRRND